MGVTCIVGIIDHSVGDEYAGGRGNGKGRVKGSRKGEDKKEEKKKKN
jgi:hypothetical protein